MTKAVAEELIVAEGYDPNASEIGPLLPERIGIGAGHPPRHAATRQAIGKRPPHRACGIGSPGRSR